MAVRKSRRLRRNLKKSRRNRNRNRYYRGGVPDYADMAKSIMDNNNNSSDPNFQSNIIAAIKNADSDPETRDAIANNIAITYKNIVGKEFSTRLKTMFPY
jgi:hypothetical protein